MTEEKTLKLATLVFPVREGEVLLAIKARSIGMNCRNGYGGGVEPGETLLQSAVREFGEETGGVVIKEEDLNKIGIVHFKNNKQDGTIFVCSVYIYTVEKWKGEFVSTDEMLDPKWFPISSIPELPLMLADKFWLPRMISGEYGEAYAEYGPRQETLIGDVRFELIPKF